MTGFEPRISGIGSDCSTNWATTTSQQFVCLLVVCCYYEMLFVWMEEGCHVVANTSETFPEWPDFSKLKIFGRFFWGLFWFGKHFNLLWQLDCCRVKFSFLWMLGTLNIYKLGHLVTLSCPLIAWSYGGGGGTQINMLFIPDQMLGFIFLQLWPKDGFDKKLFLSKNQKIQERAFFLSFFFFSFFLFTWNFVQNVIRVFSLQLGNLFFKAFQPFWRHYFTYFKPISAHQWMLSLSFLISRLKVSIC